MSWSRARLGRLLFSQGKRHPLSRQVEEVFLNFLIVRHSGKPFTFARVVQALSIDHHHHATPLDTHDHNGRSKLFS